MSKMMQEAGRGKDRDKLLRGGGRPVRTLLLGRSQATSVELQAVLTTVGGLSVETLTKIGELPASFEGNAQRPELLLIDMNEHGDEDFEILRDLRKLVWTEHIPIVALTERDKPQLALKAMRAGADDVLLKPIEVGEAKDLLANVLNHPRIARATPVAVGKLIVFMHLTGGAGATTLAVNAASALAQAQHANETCLLDLDIQFGNAASLLDLAADSPMQDFVDDPRRLDVQMLEGLTIEHKNGMRVLTAPRTLLPLTAYPTDGVTSLLELTKQRFGYGVVDLPVALVPWTDAVLRAAAVIYLVSPLTVPSTQRVMNFLTLLREEGMMDLPVKLVANRYVGSRFRSNDITLEQFEKATGRKIDFLIPNDYALISASQREGKPAVELKPKSEFARAIRAMLETDIGRDAFDRKEPSFFSSGR
jgi:pilus assembly protein CpaE